MTAANADIEGLAFDLDTFAVHDGPGIRMALYLMGCPLSCAWCHSPESQSTRPQLTFARERCVLCGACAAVCPQGAHQLNSDHLLRRELCQACGYCAEVCAQGALVIKGYRMSAQEAIARATRMKPFFGRDGGITLTGGEVTLQPEFAAAVLAGCQREGIHTAIETSGACSWEVLESLLRHTDLVLYDLKLMDDAAHRRWVGASNRRILANAARLAGRDVQVRVPLVPGITDTRENLEATFRFMRDVGLSRAALLPYNEAAGAKYEWLDQPYAIRAARQSPQALEELLTLARAAGITASVA